MDTSERYIKMCDCPEIRKEYKRIHDVGDGREIWDDKDFVKWKDSHRIWLPRQDQIQEMIQEKFSEFYEMHCTFCNWALGMAEEFPSGEQLWLVFYMKEKYGKRWIAKKWTK